MTDAMNDAIAALKASRASESEIVSRETVEQPTADVSRETETPAEEIVSRETEPPRETPVPPEPPVAPADPPERLTRSWAAVAKQEAYNREQKRLLTEQKAALDAATHELQELRQIKHALTQDPADVLDKLGDKNWYQKITERLIKNPDGNGRPGVEEKVAKLEAELERVTSEREQWFEEKLKKHDENREMQSAHQQRAGQYLQQLNELVGKDERFEVTRNWPGGIDTVVEVVNGHLAKTGQLLSPEEAATLVEGELTQHAEALLKAQKLRAKLGIDKQTSKIAVAKAPGAPPTTLTENLTASSNGIRSGPLSDHERFGDAAKLLRTLRDQRESS